MTIEEFSQIATVKDLEVFHERIINDVKGILKKQNAPQFYTPKEFSAETGMKYSTVVYNCKMGKLKARQNSPSSSWQIYSSEIERFREEASENMI